MIEFSTNNFLSPKPNFTKAKVILAFVLLGILAFSTTQCRSLTIPRENEFINQSDWKRNGVDKLAYHSKHVNLFLYAESFSQSKAVYIEIIPLSRTENEEDPLKYIEKARLFFNKKRVLLHRMGWGYRGFLGIHPKQKVGKNRVRLKYTYKGRKFANVYPVLIKKTKFKVRKKKMLLKKYSNIDQKKRKDIWERINKEAQKKRELFKIVSKNKIRHRIAHPRDKHYITSKFWVKRMYLRYRYKNKKRVYYRPRIKYHRGLDLRGRTGTPIYALASGKVVLADRLYYEGYFTVVDHGNNIFSGYMHQSKLLVDKGDKVRAGKKIGLVGQTGACTGPHLHVFFKIQGVYVDPLSVLSLPIRG